MHRDLPCMHWQRCGARMKYIWNTTPRGRGRRTSERVCWLLSDQGRTEMVPSGVSACFLTNMKEKSTAAGQHNNSNNNNKKGSCVKTCWPAGPLSSDPSVNDLCHFAAQIGMQTCTFPTPAPPEELLPLHATRRVTFEVGSDASVVARCASHQFVQEVRWRGGLGRPAGELHVLTEHRPATGRDLLLYI